MKKVINIALILILSLPLCGYTLKGGVTYTVEQARKEAFADVEYRLPQSIINAHLKDPNYEENMKAKGKGYIDMGDRYIGFFSSSVYGVLYKKNQYYEYYYYPNGKLKMIAMKTGLTYPAKNLKYDVNGELKAVTLFISKKESYIFTPEGKLVSHWIDNKCYDLNGKLIIERY